MSMFERVATEEICKGKTISVSVDRFRFDDGSETEREVVHHPGAVAIVAHDGERLYLVEHVREVVGEEALLELPAGKLDEDGESPLDTAKRELGEELGLGARDWRPITDFYTSPGTLTEKMHLFLATGLYDADVERDDQERMEIVTVALSDLDDAIERCHDAKSLVGLLWLKLHGTGG
jgi:8-oxo-dGTP pyrophosphatase MutT (NUDIX family)